MPKNRATVADVGGVWWRDGVATSPGFENLLRGGALNEGRCSWSQRANGMLRGAHLHRALGSPPIQPQDGDPRCLPPHGVAGDCGPSPRHVSQ
jgi:hypothetical protein